MVAIPATRARQRAGNVDVEVFCARQAEAIRVLGKRVVGDITACG